jgi:putative ABC transport system substrate-binding protein
MKQVRAAIAATTTIPIVMPSSAYPVEGGWVRSVAQPGGNVTGMAIAVDRGKWGKQVHLLKEAAPRASRVAILTSSPALRPGEPDILKPTLAMARQLGVTVFPAFLDSAAQLETTLSTVARERADALWVDSTGPIILRRREIAEFELRHRLPLVADAKEIAEAGGLIAYAPDLYDMFRRAPRYVDQILKGAKPGDLPVQQGDRWSLVINLKTAKVLGLAIPPRLLLQADQLIE